MEKQDLIKEIQRIAEENGGKAPGAQRFQNETGIRKSEWYPYLWDRWGDALIEAGYSRNEYRSAYDVEYLILKYIELIQELGHFPIAGELRRKRETDKNFPSHTGFNRLENKQERIRKIIEYCKDKSAYDDVLSICLKVQEKEPEKTEEGETDSTKHGYVYMIQHGKRNEYKIGMTYNTIRREGEIRLQLPEKVQPIHYIETDDPAGIEKYWHDRFSEKRKEGEWFELKAEDVRAFKKWKRIY